MNPLIGLSNLGQAVWLDYIRRSFVDSGALRRLVDEDGLKGVTSNPSIFQKAVSGSDDYADVLAEAEREGLDAGHTYERLAVGDIRMATDVLAPVYEATRRADGYVSLEVSPDLAFETDATIEEARRLWREVGRPNLMIKVPGTPEGLPAIEQLLSEGINVNVTLLFAVDVYEAVAERHLRGLERRVAAGGDISGVASVASFFVSRIDTEVDRLLDERAKVASGGERELLTSLRGRAAIANAKRAYQSYLTTIATPRWGALSARGAMPQRLLWASTSTKDPSYRDVLYVEELAGPDTVNTMPLETIDAFRDHGRVRRTIDENVDEAERVLATLGELGISLHEVTDRLTQRGVELFASAFHALLEAVGEARRVG